MFKLHVYSQERDLDREVEVRGDSVTIGRAADCDIVLDRKDISRHHARILRGVVVDDLGSRNGTHIGGARVTRATLLEARGFQVGDPATNNLVTVEVLSTDVPFEDAAGEFDPDLTEVGLGAAAAQPGAARAPQPVPAPPPPDFVALREELQAETERHRSKCVLLEIEVDKLRRELRLAQAAAGDHSALEEQQGENRRLLQRIESLKSEIEAREKDDAHSVQARLATDELALVRRRCEELQLELDAARTRAAAPGPAHDSAVAERQRQDLEARFQACESELAQARRELAGARRAETQLAEHTELVRKLREELEAARAAPPPAAAPLAVVGPRTPMSALLEKLERERNELRLELQQARSERGVPAAGAAAAPLLFQDLQRENDALKRQLAALQGRASAGDAGLEERNAELRAEVERVTRELYQTRVKLTARPGSAPPAPAVRVAQAGELGALLRRLVDGDPRENAGGAALSPEEFLVTEQYICFRNVERVVTRMAGEFMQLFDARTVMPGADGDNFRIRAGAVLDAPGDAAARRELAEYMELLARWFAASLQAHRRAACRFANDLRGELSESALGKLKPIPAYLRLSGRAEVELWARAQAYLRELSSSTIDERLERLAREEATAIVNSSPPPGV